MEKSSCKSDPVTHEVVPCRIGTQRLTRGARSRGRGWSECDVYMHTFSVVEAKPSVNTFLSDDKVSCYKAI